MKKWMYIGLMAMFALNITSCWYSSDCWDEYEYDDDDWDITDCFYDKYNRYACDDACIYNNDKDSWDCPPAYWYDVSEYFFDNDCSELGSCFGLCLDSSCYNYMDNWPSCSWAQDSYDNVSCESIYSTCIPQEYYSCRWEAVCDEDDCKWYSETCAPNKVCINGLCRDMACLTDEDNDSNDDGNDHNSDHNGSDNNTGNTCQWNSDCPENHVCSHGICHDINSGNENSGNENSGNDDNVSVDPEPVPECTQNSDCDADSICTEGRCIPCQTDACDTTQEIECVFSSQCESGLCVDGACLAPGACAIDANCSEGQICLDGACIARPECLDDSECGEGRICNADNKCEDDVECRQDNDCGEGLICIQNMCAQCRLNCECPNEGDICMNGTCIAG